MKVAAAIREKQEFGVGWGVFLCLSCSKRIKRWLKCLNVREIKYDLQVETQSGGKRKKRTSPKDEVLSLQARLPADFPWLGVGMSTQQKASIRQPTQIWLFAPLSTRILQFHAVDKQVLNFTGMQGLLEWLSQYRGKGLRLSTLCSWIKPIWFSHCPGAQRGTGSLFPLEATEIIPAHAFAASPGTVPALLPPCIQPGWVGCLNFHGADIWDCPVERHQGAKPNQRKCANFWWYQLLLIVP